MNKAIGKYVPILIILLILTSIPYLFDSAYAEKTMFKEKADLKEPHYKMRIIEHEGIRAIAIPLYTTVDNPSNHIVGPGGDLDGVAEILLTRTDGSFLCSGALLSSGMHVLTAAHCVTDNSGNYHFRLIGAIDPGDTITVTSSSGGSATAPVRYR